ncbi:MAG: hypothetical protein K6C36_08590 [Clostridia bacterium]|nr:hypothetical protein [Clostridia bacterium]
MKRNKRLKRFLAWFIPCATVFICACVFFGLARGSGSQSPWDPSKKTNVWVNKESKSPIVADGVSEGAYPENTLLAFKSCVKDESYPASVLLVPVRITSDGELVVWENDSVTAADGKQLITGLTYEQLREYNLGEGFTAPDGTTPYNGLTGKDIPDDLRAMKLTELFSYMAQYKVVSYVVKIMDGGTAGVAAADALHTVLADNDMLGRVITWFDDNKVGSYINGKYPDMPRAATTREITYFWCNARFDQSRAQSNYRWAVIIVSADSFFRKDTTVFLNYAHKHNRAVIFTDVDEAKTSASALSSLYADGLITAKPVATAAAMS